MAKEDDLLPLLYGEVDIIEEYGTVAVNGFQTFYMKNLVARFTSPSPKSRATCPRL